MGYPTLLRNPPPDPLAPTMSVEEDAVTGDVVDLVGSGMATMIRISLWVPQATLSLDLREEDDEREEVVALAATATARKLFSFFILNNSILVGRLLLFLLFLLYLHPCGVEN